MAGANSGRRSASAAVRLKSRRDSTDPDIRSIEGALLTKINAAIDDELANTSGRSPMLLWSLLTRRSLQKQPATALQTVAAQAEAREATWCRIAAGCHLDRKIDELIRLAGFDLSNASR